MWRCQNLSFFYRNHFWATFIDIWRFFSGHTGSHSQSWMYSGCHNCELPITGFHVYFHLYLNFWKIKQFCLFLAIFRSNFPPSASSTAAETAPDKIQPKFERWMNQNFIHASASEKMLAEGIKAVKLFFLSIQRTLSVEAKFCCRILSSYSEFTLPIFGRWIAERLVASLWT